MKPGEGNDKRGLASMATLPVFYIEAHCAKRSLLLQKIQYQQFFGSPSLRDSRVPNYVVQSDVAARLHTISCEEEGHACYVLHSVPALVENESLGTEATFIAEQETKGCM